MLINIIDAAKNRLQSPIKRLRDRRFYRNPHFFTLDFGIHEVLEHALGAASWHSGKRVMVAHIDAANATGLDTAIACNESQDVAA